MKRGLAMISVRDVAVAAVAAAMVLGLCSSAALADPVIFSATDFGDVYWDIPVVITSGAGGTASGWHVETGGHTGAYRQCQITFNEGGPASVWAFHRCIQFSYEPATQGAISSVDYSEWVISMGSPAGQDTGPALRQNGTVYAVSSLFAGDADWTHKWIDGLQASDFTAVGGSGHPDFSASGEIFDVGFISLHSTPTLQHGAFSNDIGIDNWTFTVVPEPATLSLLALGGLLALRRRRR
jgi:hypothetical protein